MKNKILFLDFDGVLHPDRYSLTSHDPDRVFRNNEIFSQPSLLSDNGAGEHIKSYKDKLIIYPHTKIDKEKIKNYLKKKYSLIIDDVSGDLIFAIK